MSAPTLAWITPLASVPADLAPPAKDDDSKPATDPVGPPGAALEGDLTGPVVAEWTAAPAEAVYLRGGWALLDDWTPSEEELADRQERAWEAADEVNARWRAALRVLPHLSASRARVVWLRLLTVVSWLPAPDRDALRGYLTTNLPLEVLAVSLRMPEHLFCELLEAATETLLGPVSDKDALKSLTVILTRAAGRLDRRVPTAPPLATHAARRPAVRQTLIPAGIRRCRRRPDDRHWWRRRVRPVEAPADQHADGEAGHRDQHQPAEPRPVLGSTVPSCRCAATVHVRSPLPCASPSPPHPERPPSNRICSRSPTSAA